MSSVPAGVPVEPAGAGSPDERYASDPARPMHSASTPWWRWLFLAPGLAIVAYGFYGLLTAGGRVPLDAWLTWFVGSALLHDLVLAPVWVGLGWVAAKTLPRPARGPVVVGAAVSGVLTLVALPFVLGYGGDPGDWSFLPRDYGQTLLVLVAVVLAVAAAWATVATLRERTSRSRD